MSSDFGLFGATMTNSDMVTQFQYRTARMLTMPNGDIPLNLRTTQTSAKPLHRSLKGWLLDVQCRYEMKHDEKHSATLESKVTGGRSDRITATHQLPTDRGYW